MEVTEKRPPWKKIGRIVLRLVLLLIGEELTKPSKPPKKDGENKPE